MIKNFLTSKIIATASTETTVIGLKLIDAGGHGLHTAGLILAIVSATILIMGWATHGKNEAGTAAKVAGPGRRSRRSRPSRAR